MPNIELYNADAYEKIKEIKDGSVDLIIIDPPYDMRVFGYNENASENSVSAKYFNKRPHIKELGNNTNLTQGLKLDILWGEFLRIQPFINCYIFCNARLLQYILYFLYQKEFYKVEILVMQKKNPMPSYKFHYLNDIEYIVYACDKKSSLDFGTQNTMFRASHFYKYNTRQYKLTTHATEKPIDLISKLILNSSKKKEKVLDCFMGSGTTAHACKILDRDFIGIEIDEKWYEVAQGRLKTQVQGLLFNNF